MMRKILAATVIAFSTLWPPVSAEDTELAEKEFAEFDTEYIYNAIRVCKPLQSVNLYSNGVLAEMVADDLGDEFTNQIIISRLHINVDDLEWGNSPFISVTIHTVGDAFEVRAVLYYWAIFGPVEQQVTMPAIVSNASFFGTHGENIKFVADFARKAFQALLARYITALDC